MSENPGALERQLDDRDPAAPPGRPEPPRGDARAWRPPPRRSTTRSTCTATPLFSFNGYGYSPSGRCAGAPARAERHGLVDFDVLDGVAEFLDRLRAAGMRGGAGLETRCTCRPSGAGHHVAGRARHHLPHGHGLRRRAPVAEAACLAGLKETAQAHAPAGGAGEHPAGRHRAGLRRRGDPPDAGGQRHGAPLCAAYYDKAAAVFPDRGRRAAWWAVSWG
jgi:hypothetical protein